MTMRLNLEIPEAVEAEEDATEKQKDLIRHLVKEVGSVLFPETTIQELSRWQASSIIEQLLDYKP